MKKLNGEVFNLARIDAKGIKQPVRRKSGRRPSPRPWVVTKSDFPPYSPYEPRSEYCWRTVVHDRHGCLICEFMFGEEHNAPVIAAAPEMLVALRSISKWAKSNNYDGSFWDYLSLLIAQAEGKS
jgi:hypothetical protein